MLCKVVASSLDHSLMLWRFQSSDSKAYRCPIMNPKHIPNPPLMSHHYRYTGHTGPILDVQFSRTGSLIASSARDSTVRLWVPDLKGDSQVLNNLFASLPHYNNVRAIIIHKFSGAQSRSRSGGCAECPVQS